MANKTNTYLAPDSSGLGATGINSHVEGLNTMAFGETSHAEGLGDTMTPPKTTVETISNVVPQGFTTNTLHSSMEIITFPNLRGQKGKSYKITYVKEVQPTTPEGAVTYEISLDKPIEFVPAITTPTAVDITVYKNTFAYGEASHHEGKENRAYGTASHAEGQHTTASGGDSHAEGYGSEARGGTTHAEGYWTKAIGNASHAEGVNTQAHGKASHSEGLETRATHMGSHSEGAYIENIFMAGAAKSLTYDVTIDGKPEKASPYIIAGSKIYSTDGTELARVKTVEKNTEGIVTSITLDKTLDALNPVVYSTKYFISLNPVKNSLGSHSEGQWTMATNESSHAEGHGTIASGKASHAEGSYTEAKNHNAHAEGLNSIASGQISHAEGENTTALGTSSHTEGKSTNQATEKVPNLQKNTSDQTIVDAWKNAKFSLSKGEGSHTEGNNCLALGYASHAEGIETVATAICSHTEGGGTNVSSTGTYSHAEGYGTTASGKGGSHAEGYMTTASGQSSHAEGDGTTASGMFSHAGGIGTEAKGNAEVGLGRYNYSIYNGDAIKQNTAFTIGNGTDNFRSNIFEVKENGDVYILGLDSEVKYNGRNSFGSSTGTDQKLKGKTLQEVLNGKSGQKTSDGGEIFNDYTSNKATRPYSHAEGEDTTATGDRGSHAEGHGTTASGRWGSHAEGYGTTASGESAHAEGNNTTASGNDSHAEGKFNVDISSAIHMVGIGTGNSSDPDEYRNAHTITTDGKHYIPGIGTYQGTEEILPEGQDLATIIKRDENDILALKNSVYAKIEPNIKKELPYKYKNGNVELPVFRKYIEFPLNDVTEAEIIIEDNIPGGKTLKILNDYNIRYEFESILNPLELNADYVSYSNLNLIDNIILLSEYTSPEEPSKTFRKGSILLSSKQGKVIGMAYTTIDYVIIDSPKPEIKTLNMTQDSIKVTTKAMLSHYNVTPAEVGTYYSNTADGPKTKIKDESYVPGNKVFGNEIFLPEQGKTYYVGNYADEVYTKSTVMDIPVISFENLTETHNINQVTLSAKVNNLYIDENHPATFNIWYKNDDGTYTDKLECTYDEQTRILTGTMNNPNEGDAEKSFMFGLMANGVRSSEISILMPVAPNFYLSKAKNPKIAGAFQGLCDAGLIVSPEGLTKEEFDNNYMYYSESEGIVSNESKAGINQKALVGYKPYHDGRTSVIAWDVKSNVWRCVASYTTNAPEEYDVWDNSAYEGQGDWRLAEGRIITKPLFTVSLGYPKNNKQYNTPSYDAMLQQVNYDFLQNI